MVKIVPTHPELVAEHQDTILASIDDEDISIRMRALDLVTALVSRFCFFTFQTFPHTNTGDTTQPTIYRPAAPVSSRSA